MNKLTLVIIGLCLGICTVFLKGILVMFFVIILAGVALHKYLPLPDKKYLLRLFISGLAIRILLLTSYYAVSIATGGNGEMIPDSRLYFLRALSNLRIWTGQEQFPYQVEGNVGENGYIYILSFYYYLINFIPQIPNPVSLFSEKLINCLIGVLSAIPVFYISKEIFNRKIAKVSSFLAIFYPSLILWSITNVREPINILLASLGLFSMMRLFKNKEFKYLVILVISLLLLIPIRKYFFLFMLTVGGISFLVYLFLYYGKQTMRSIFALIAILIFLSFTDFGKGIKTRYLAKVNFDNFAQKLYVQNDGFLSEGGVLYKIYDNGFICNGKVDEIKFIKAFIKGWGYFLLVPLPWWISSFSQLSAYPQLILWYCLLPFALIGLIFAIRYRFRESVVIIIYLLTVTSQFALVEANVGTAMRHRDLVIVFYFIFAAAGLFKLFRWEMLTEKLEVNSYNVKC